MSPWGPEARGSSLTFNVGEGGAGGAGCSHRGEQDQTNLLINLLPRPEILGIVLARIFNLYDANMVSTGPGAQKGNVLLYEVVRKRS